MTSYLIPRQVAADDGSAAWLDAGTVDATSAPTAVRRWAERQSDEFAGATVRCIPVLYAREFKPTPRRAIDLA
jgi:hypothetical protein